MNKYIVVLLFLCSLEAFGQSGFENRYNFNFLAINPAFAGENGNFGLRYIGDNRLNRSFAFSKLNQIFVLDGKLYNNSGLAFQAYRVNVGYNATGLSLAYSKGFESNDFKGKVGVTGGVNIVPVISSFEGAGNLTSGILGVGGIFGYKAVYMGFSAPTLLAGKSYTSFNSNQYYGQLGYKFDIPIKPNFKFNAYGLLRKYENVDKLKFDLNLTTKVISRVGLGLSMRQVPEFTSTSKKFYLYPSGFYTFNKITLGLGYSSDGAVGQTSPNTQIVDVAIQFFFKYNSDGANDSSWFGQLF
ncbi:MAG: hypothetical protein ACRCVT_09310 [Leadbetterella sp.]